MNADQKNPVFKSACIRANPRQLFFSVFSVISVVNSTTGSPRRSLTVAFREPLNSSASAAANLPT
jgi:hypothetical protein